MGPSAITLAIGIGIGVAALTGCGSATTTQVAGRDPATTVTDAGPVATNGLSCSSFFGISPSYAGGGGASTPQEAVTSFIDTAGRSVRPPLPSDGYQVETVVTPPTAGQPETLLLIHATDGVPDVSFRVINPGSGWFVDSLNACGDHTAGLPATGP